MQWQGLGVLEMRRSKGKLRYPVKGLTSSVLNSRTPIYIWSLMSGQWWRAKSVPSLSLAQELLTGKS